MFRYPFDYLLSSVYLSLGMYMLLTSPSKSFKYYGNMFYGYKEQTNSYQFYSVGVLGVSCLDSSHHAQVPGQFHELVQRHESLIAIPIGIPFRLDLGSFRNFNFFSVRYPNQFPNKDLLPADVPELCEVEVEGEVVLDLTDEPEAHRRLSRGVAGGLQIPERHIGEHGALRANQHHILSEEQPLTPAYDLTIMRTLVMVT